MGSDAREEPPTHGATLSAPPRTERVAEDTARFRCRVTMPLGRALNGSDKTAD